MNYFGFIDLLVDYCAVFFSMRFFFSFLDYHCFDRERFSDAIVGNEWSKRMQRIQQNINIWSEKLRCCYF